MKIEIIPYRPQFKESWDRLVEESHTGTFLHNRDYMEYHKARFEDFSLMVYAGKKLLGILPANKENNSLFSHQGLTYADLLLLPDIKMDGKREILQSLQEFLSGNSIDNWKIKSIPSFFHKIPDESLAYLYHQKGAILDKISAFYYISPHNYRLNTNRKRNIKKMEKRGGIRLSYDQKYLKEYWKLSETNLAFNHSAKPVHSYEEMKYLMEKFPRNIQLVSLLQKDRLLAGVVLFHINRRIHFQYINATIEEDMRNAIDLLNAKIIEEGIKQEKYISLGTAEKEGKPNEGLVYWKESFGAQIFNQYFYDLQIK